MSIRTGSFVGSVVVALTLSAIASSSAALAAGYTVVDLGSTGAGFHSGALAVNDAGRASGWVGAVPGIGTGYAAVFQNGADPVALNGLLGQGRAINNRGDVVGSYTDPGQCCFFSFYSSKGATSVAPTLGGFLGTALMGINDRSTAIGWSQATDGYPHAVLYRNGKLVDLGTWGGQYALGLAINNAGTMAGTRYLSNTGVIEGVVVDPSGTVTPLPPLVGAAWVQPYAINQRGDVVGQQSQAAGFAGPRFGFALIGSQSHTLALPDANSAVAYAINNRGTVVGTSDTGIGTSSRAFVWRDGVATDLSALPEALATGWSQLIEATGINSRGVIVGSGLRADGTIRAFMLVPD